MKTYIKVLPYLVFEKIKLVWNSLIRSWGTGIIISILILHVLWCLDLIYYKIQANIEIHIIDHLKDSIKQDNKLLMFKQNKLKCIKWQINRITEDKEIKFWFCNK